MHHWRRLIYDGVYGSSLVRRRLERRGVVTMRRQTVHGARIAATPLVVLLFLGPTGCSNQDDPADGGAVPVASTSPEPTANSTSDPGSAGSTGTASPVPDPVVATYVPILRNGKPPHPTVSAKPVPFDGVVRWSDGLRLDILAVEQGKVEGVGPGVIVGEPTTSLTVRMTNRSNRTVSLDGVVVTMLYGADQRQARPVYDDKDARDLTGVLKPGRSATAVYIFSVPRTELDRLLMYVDFDGVHTAAIFNGSLK